MHHIEHHLAHLSSAFHVSPFEEAVVVSVDGFGDFSSAAWGVGKGKDISVDGRVYFPHSLGIFYQALTQYLGFPHYGDEYKVMGLAPYGKPAFMDAMRKIVRLKPDGGYELDLTYFRHHKEQVSYQWTDGSPEFGDLFAPALEALLGPRRAPHDPLDDRHRDIARSVQAMYEEAFFHLIGVLQKRYGLTNLALAGGCAMNSVANGKVRRMTPFRRVYVQSAAGDAGGAIGAAFVVWHKLGGARSFVMDHAYWGPQFGSGEIDALIAARKSEIDAAGCSVEDIADEAELCRRTAAAIAEGKVVGWFQGRMEWGPRALGNRSIVCDPRRADMKAILNAKIKRRESFRPFAPSVLEEAVTDWFEEDDARPLHDAGVPDPRGEAGAHPGSHACRWFWPAADGLSAHQSALLSADRELIATSPACRWCSTPRSTRTSRWCASRRRRSIAFCAPDGRAGAGEHDSCSKGYNKGMRRWFQYEKQ